MTSLIVYFIVDNQMGYLLLLLSFSLSLFGIWIIYYTVYVMLGRIYYCRLQIGLSTPSQETGCAIFSIPNETLVHYSIKYAQLGHLAHIPYTWIIKNIV